jgi:polysaccharide biosynthesis transport protein
MMDGNDGFPIRQATESGTSSFLTHLPAMLWQRRLLIAIPAILGTIAAISALLLIQPTYRSSAVMMVQSPQLPGEVTGTIASELIDRRIARYREQITSRPELVSLIEKHNLYSGDRARKPLSKVVDKMRDAISVTATQSDIVSARPEDRTIAFKLAYNYSEPVSTQAVAQHLMERILELDQSRQSEQSVNAVQFLSDQAKALEEQISTIQGQISGITAANGGVLAGSTGVTMLGSDSGIQTQIAQLQRDNATLAQQKSLARTSDDRDPAVAAAESQLAAARAQYSDTHPDVVIAKARLAEARALATNNVKKLPVSSIDDQIAFNNSQIAQLRAAQAQQIGQINQAMGSKSRAPLVQQQIADLNSKLIGLNDQYKGVSSRLLAARAGMRAEDQQMGERLSTVEPPVVPDSPASPNRLLILAAGILGGLGLGAIMALGIEILLAPIRDPTRLASIMGAQPLGVIPVINTNLPNAEPARWYEFWKRFKR